MQSPLDIHPPTRGVDRDRMTYYIDDEANLEDSRLIDNPKRAPHVHSSQPLGPRGNVALIIPDYELAIRLGIRNTVPPFLSLFFFTRFFIEGAIVLLLGKLCPTMR